MLNKKILFRWCALTWILFSLTACQRSDHIAYGYIEGRLTYVSSQTAGTLRQLAVAKGAWVKTGDYLFTLDPSPENLEYTQAKAAFAQAQANLANLEKGLRPTELAALEAQKNQVIAQLVYAQKTKERYATLLQKHYIEKAQYDQASSTVDSLKAQIDQISEQIKTGHLSAREDEVKAARANVETEQAAMNKAEWTLGQKKIFAPITGEVFDTFFRQGELVADSHPVLAILAPENTYLVFYIPELNLSEIHLGQSVNIVADNAKTPLPAIINYISPQAEYTPPVIYSEQSRADLVYRIEASLIPEETKFLHPGQPVTVDLGDQKKQKSQSHKT